MADVQKQASLAHDLASELTLTQALAVTESFGTTGLPLVRVGSASAGSAGALIRVAPQSWALATDILGLAQVINSPSVIQVVLELNPAGGAGADVTSHAQLAAILAPIARRGTAIEIYDRANGGQPVETDITSGNLKTTLNAHPVYGMIANV